MKQKAALYVRSATSNESGTLSLKAQEAAGREYARRKGLTVVGTWKDAGCSALGSRGALREFVEFAKAHPQVRVLLFERPDRISRRTRELLAVYEPLRRLGKDFRFFGGGQEVYRPAMWDILTTFVRWELELRRRARKGKSDVRRRADEPRA